MALRRIVTGRDSTGKSVFASDGEPTNATKFQHVPGMEAVLVWETKPEDQLPCDGADLTTQCTSWVPQPGGTNLLVITFPPQPSTMPTPEQLQAAGAEAARIMPGLAEKFEPDAPGMHTTDSVDYGILLSGELELELDDGQVRSLKPHDIVVQNGTRHAWRNKSGQPATMLFVLTGAPKKT